MRQIKKSAFVATVYGRNFGGTNIPAGLMQQNDRLISGVIFCRRNERRRLTVFGASLHNEASKPAQARLQHASAAAPEPCIGSSLNQVSQSVG
jgi:hypothetical protein